MNISKPKYEIGKAVFYGSYESEGRWITCPDCFGQKYLEVILGDQSHVTIDCETCRQGFEHNTGVVKVYDRKPFFVSAVVTGVEVEDNSYRYRTSRAMVMEEHLFESCAEALDDAQHLAKAADEYELKRIQEKEKPAKTWAWHVTYHRRQVKEHQKQLAYHIAKLDVAKQHAKKGETSGS